MLTGSVSTVSPMEWAGVTFGGRERQGSCDLNDDRAGELVPTWRPARVLVLTGANASGLRKQVLRKAFATSNAVSDTRECVEQAPFQGRHLSHPVVLCWELKS